jgi:hypothetical protein
MLSQQHEAKIPCYSTVDSSYDGDCMLWEKVPHLTFDFTRVIQLYHLYFPDERSLPLLNYYASVFLPQFPVDGWGIASLGAPLI